MKTNFKCFLIVACFNLFVALSSVSASHLAGGEITYRCLGFGQYQIIATIYRDCAGIALALPQLTYSCGTTNLTVTMTPLDTVDVSPPCGGGLTTCHGGTLPGIQRYDFTATLNLLACADWRLSCSLSGSNGSYIDILGGTFYIETNLNDSSTCYDSPVFNSDPTFFVCANQWNYIDCSVAINNDSLAYSLVCVPVNSANCATYNSGYSPTHFLEGTAMIDSITGILSVYPTATQVAIYSVLVKQYRNGVLIGSVMRDANIYVTVCSNTMPTLSGIDSSNIYTTETCAGDSLCFNIFSNDADVGQQLTLTLDNDSGHTIIFDTTTATLHPTATVCVPTTLADSGTQIYFTIMVKDNNCPTNGVEYYSYCVNVVYGNLHPNLSFLNDTIYCNYFGASSYQWYLDSNPVGGNYPFIYAAGIGNYYVDVTDSNGCNGRSDTLLLATSICDCWSLPLLSIFPNPSKGVFAIQYFSDGNSNISIKVFDLMGKVVYNAKENGVKNFLKEIDLREAANGVYMLEIISGEFVRREKIIKD